MNLRELCRLRDYETVIGTTYSFDPLFFERVILRDLRLGNGRRIIIIGDASQLSESINRCSSQLKQIGNTVIIEPIHLKGAFHPKILLKLCRNSAILAIGSGNMTNGGWGDNQEIFTKWEIKKDNPNSAAIISKVIKWLFPYVQSEIAQKSLNRIYDKYASGNNSENSEFDFYITEQNKTLSEFIKTKWQGKKFYTLKIFTGSTDKKGAFIKWCHDNFGIRKCIVAANEYNISFDLNEINKIPVDISISPIESNSMMHAKFYLFEGQAESCVITGSANCSSRAWLQSPENGGNVEAIVVYDNIDLDNFNEIVDNFSTETISIDQIKHKEVEQNNSTSYKFLISSLTLDILNNELRLEFKKAPPVGSEIEVIINKNSYKLVAENPSVWRGNIVDIQSDSFNKTLFGDIYIFEENKEPTIIHHWINNISNIEFASKSRQISNALQKYINSSNNDEFNNASKEIALVCNKILEEPDLFEDPIFIKHKSSKKDFEEDTQNTTPLTSDSLFKSMADIDENTNNILLTGGKINTSLSISSIIGFFFDYQDELNNSPTDTEEEIGIDDVEEVDAKDTHKQTVNNNKPQSQCQKIDKKIIQKLNKQISEYFTKLRDESFRDNCSVTRFKEAISLPLVIGVVGKQSGWLDPFTFQNWVITIIDIIFNMEIDSHKGLIDYVKSRYYEDKRSDIFNQVIGDGTLWVALLTGIGEAEWEGENSKINKAIAISTVMQNQSIISSTNVGQLKALIDNHKFKQTADWIKNKPQKIIKSLKELNRYLDKHFNTFLNNQIGEEHCRGDLVYGDRGWGFVQNEKVSIDDNTIIKAYMHSLGKEFKVKSSGFYVNLRIAQKNDAKLRRLLLAINEI